MHRYGRQAFAQSWYSVSRLVTIIVGGAVAGLTGAIIGFVIAPAIGALATLRRLGGRHDDSPPPSASLAPPHLPGAQAAEDVCAARGGPAFLATLLSVDLLAFKRVGTPTDAGRYAAAATIAHVPFFLLAPPGSWSCPRLPRRSRRRRGPRTHAPRTRAGRDPTRVGDTVVLLALPTALIVALGDERSRSCSARPMPSRG